MTDYVPILNAEHGDREFVLLDVPRGVSMHWDRETKRTRLCMVFLLEQRGEKPPLSVCSWCEREVPSKGYLYAPCGFWRVQEGGRVWTQGLVQLPMGFVFYNAPKLVKGRWVRVRGLRVEGKLPFWEAGKLTDAPESFDVLEALMHIQGVQLPQAANEEAADGKKIIPFRKEA